MVDIRKIVREQIELLIEREMKSSVPLPKIVSIVSKFNFLPPYEITKEWESSPTLTLYYDYKNKGDIEDYNICLRRDFNKLQEVARRAGWIISSWGGHYDGLRNYYLRFQDKHPEFGVGTFFVNMETEYGQTMDDYFGTDTYELKNQCDFGVSKYGDNEHLGVIYHRGIFYHFTTRKNLKPILAHGLKPMNGGGITVWRNTSQRIYLSLLPEFDKIDYGYGDDITNDDTVLLKIDLRPVMKNFDFYVDDKYENAVYTTSNIPPQFIEVVNCDKVHANYYFKFGMEDYFKRIVEANFGEYDEQTKKSKIEDYAHSIEWRMRENIDNICKRWSIDKKYVQDPNYIIREIVKDACY